LSTNIKNKKLINNGKKSSLAYPDDVKEYLEDGWKRGRGTIPINNGKKGLRVFPDVAKVYYYLNEDWITGSMPRVPYKKRKKK